MRANIYRIMFNKIWNVLVEKKILMISVMETTGAENGNTWKYTLVYIRKLACYANFLLMKHSFFIKLMKG